MSFMNELSALIGKWFGKAGDKPARDFPGDHLPPPPSAPTIPVATNGDLSLYEDGSISSAAIDAYLATYTKPDKNLLIRNFFFFDNDVLFPGVTLTKVQSDNIAKNKWNVHSPASVGLMNDNINSMMYAQSGVRPNGVIFDSKQSKTLPYALASRRNASDIQAIIETWKAPGITYYPHQVTSEGSGAFIAH